MKKTVAGHDLKMLVHWQLNKDIKMYIYKVSNVRVSNEQTGG